MRYAVSGKVTACSWPDVTFSDLHTFIAPEGLCQCIFLVAGVWSANRKLGLSSGEWARQRYSREMIPIGTHSSRPVQRRPAQTDPGFRDHPTLPVAHVCPVSACRNPGNEHSLDEAGTNGLYL
ncbi:MAG: hypothetical protein JO185_19295 [Acidobacteriaceae bacterium]|nr:hypothetical protein [Acidobacteriaceae bacterium]